MQFHVHMVGGGRLTLDLDARDLTDVSDTLRRERGLMGEAFDDDASRMIGRVLIPQHRIQLIAEA